jgi:hypothetical protein
MIIPGQFGFNCPSGFREEAFWRKFKMAATAGHRLTLDPMGKCSNAFFSETTNIIKAKLYMKVHWMVLYKLRKFVEDHPMNIHVQFGLNNICSFWEEGIWTFSHRVIKAKLYMNVH